jgi:hypothetical protein
LAELDDVTYLVGPGVRSRPGMNLGYETDWRKFNKLDWLERPELSEQEFYGLFTKCEACGLVMTRQVFLHHYYKWFGEDGLELTDIEE